MTNLKSMELRSVAPRRNAPIRGFQSLWLVARTRTAYPTSQTLAVTVWFNARYRSCGQTMAYAPTVVILSASGRMFHCEGFGLCSDTLRVWQATGMRQEMRAEINHGKKTNEHCNRFAVPRAPLTSTRTLYRYSTPKKTCLYGLAIKLIANKVVRRKLSGSWP